MRLDRAVVREEKVTIHSTPSSQLSTVLHAPDYATLAQLTEMAGAGWVLLIDFIDQCPFGNSLEMLRSDCVNFASFD